VKRYSQMTPNELQQELTQLDKKLTEAKAKNRESEQQILEQKTNIALAYLLDPTSIQLHTWYAVKDRTQLFRVDYIKGVFAWGTMEGSSEQVAFPISLLKLGKK
jgi:hypothetical protein